MSPRTCGTQPDWGAPVRPPSSRRWAVGLVALLLVGLLGLSAWWIAEDQYPNGYEVCEHLLYTRRMANELAGGADLGQWLADNRRIGGRTTLMHLSMASLMVRLPGDGNRMITLLSTSLSLAVLAASCFLLAEQIGETPWAGALAGALVLLLPPIWGFSRRYGTDLPLTAGVALFALVLLRCSPWQSWRRALSVGLLAGTICLSIHWRR